MMIQAFYTGVSGLKNNSTGIDVIANNIANVSTVGFRGYNTEFASLFEDAISTGTIAGQNTGTGVKVQTTSMMTEQGALTQSDRSTDLAIQGNGWFGVVNNGDTVYTRDGTFSFDSESNLVTPDGFHLTGTMAGNIGKNDTLTSKVDSLMLGDIKAQEALRFPKTLTYPPEPTTNATFFANLGVGSEAVTVSATVIDPQNNKNRLRLEFIKNENQVLPGSQYTVTATTASADGSSIYDTQTGVIKFNEFGALSSNTLTTIENNGSSVSIDLGTGYDGIISIDKPLVSGSSKVNGTIGGDLVGYTVNENAEVVATFSNSQQSVVGKIAVYHFTNEQGLERISGTRFQATDNSGKAIFYKDAEGNNITGAHVANFRLETSNVELSYGLTELIILQRSYDANSKSITTADQMMQKALDMDA